MSTKKFNFSVFEAQLFCTLYDMGTTTATAKELGVTPSLVSVTINRLEKKLNCDSFFTKDPVTGKYAPTAKAEDVIQSMRYIVQFAEDIRVKNVRSENTVTITSTHTVLHYYLGPWVKSFIDDHPNVIMNFRQDEELKFIRQDLNEVALTSHIDDKVNKKYFPYHTFKQKLWASPDYIAKHGSPSNVEELKKHRLLMRTNFEDPRILFGSYQIRSQINNDDDIRTFDIYSASLIDLLCESGCGIMAAAEESIKLVGLDLVNVYPDFEGSNFDFYVCISKEFLETQLGKDIINWIYECRNRSFRKIGVKPSFSFDPIT